MESFTDLKGQFLWRDNACAGIGTLGEKALHRILKNYIQPDRSKQVKRIGRYVADIYDGQEITEIQTRNFSPLKRKLELFLTVAPVTVVHPVLVETYVNWIEPETGEIVNRRRSSRRGSIYEVAKELIFLRPCLSYPPAPLQILIYKG